VMDTARRLQVQELTNADVETIMDNLNAFLVNATKSTITSAVAQVV
jgi:hypothetical protein